ncbi:MAG: hypothetical protein E6I80_10035 [Chloroflexi bacterium]|nr:MAG: hypothetical protein E6I80_10035 [Chloroflexota bacterium]
MNSSSRFVVRSVAWIGVAMLIIVLFHIGGSTIALRVGQFSPLTGAFIGGMLTLTCVILPIGRREATEPWLRNEQLGWILIGCGVIMWGLGESFWRYYVSIGESPFPSLADIGYFSFPLLVFTGLLLQPSSGTGRKRLLLLLDSLICMGSILAIAWYLLLGSLAQAPGEANIAKFLGLYYPISDTALLSCVLFLLLRGQGRAYQATARRVSLLVMGLGLCFFVFSDFLFNVQQNAGTYVEATWIDLGWPYGMMTIGIAACLRRFLPVTPKEVIEQRMRDRAEDVSFGLPQFAPYMLLSFLFFVLTLNVLSTDPGQLAIRPVLLLATLGVVGLVVIRQVLTLRDNARLTRQQAESLEDLQVANRRIEEQSRMIAIHNAELEQGIEHLKDVQANLANGNVHARARLASGALLPLAASLNLMADRLIRLWQTSIYAQRLVNALGELCTALDNHWKGERLIIPESCNELVEMHHLLRSMHIDTLSTRSHPINHPATHPVTQPLSHESSGHPFTPRPVTNLFSSQHGLEQQREGPSPLPGFPRRPMSAPLQANLPKSDEMKRN